MKEAGMIKKWRTEIERYLNKKRVNRKRLSFLLILFLLLALSFPLLEGKAEKAFSRKAEKRSQAAEKEARDEVISLKYERAKPFLIKDAARPSIKARSGLVVHFKQDERVLFEKEKDKALPIASLTKLMSVLVALENYDLNDQVVFSEEAAAKEGEPNFYTAGEKFYVKDLIYSALVESSNRAVFALAQKMGEKSFINAMNKKAQDLGMTNTQFFRPAGLDPDFDYEIPNYSTSSDLVKLAEVLSQNQLISDICRTRVRDIYTTSGGFHHRMDTTNEIIEEVSGLVLAKTGRTPQAGECLVLAWHNKHDGNLTIGVILGADNNFQEMKKLINWLDKAYKW